MTFITEIHWPNLVAGIAGGTVSAAILHPLDLAKVRLQVNEGTGVVPCRAEYKGTFQTLIDVARIRGFRGLYLGLTPNVLGAGSSWGLYFLLYAALKSSLQGGDPTKVIPTWEYLGCGALAGSLTLCVTNPIWVVKTRLCLQYERLAQVAEHSVGSSTGRSVSHLPASDSTWNSLVKLWRFEGVQGLYRGFVPGLFGVSHGAIQFMLYEEMRNAYNQLYRERSVNAKLTPFEYLFFASCSKLMAATLTYPYQVIRSRLQDQHRRYRGLVHVVRELWRCEGFSGFYKGLLPNLLRVTPACAITFVIYEYTVDFLKTNVWI